MNQYEIKHKLEYNKWFDFVYKHPHCNIFQSPEMYEVYKATKNYEPFFIAVVNDQNEILGTLLAVIQKEHLGLLGIFSARAIIWGGPLVKDNNLKVLDFILSEYNKVIKRRAIYSQFRNLWNFENVKHVFLSNGYKYEDHLNILVDLKKSQENLINELSYNRRYGIRRAKREGVKFSIENDISALKECYKILYEVYTYAKLPLPDFTLFSSLYEITNERLGIKIFTAQYDYKIIGCLLGLYYKDIIYDFYAGSYHKFYKKYPNDLIPLEIFLWAKENGFKTFDFGGAGKPHEEYRVRDYKKQFGGEFVNYGRFEILHKLLLYRFGKIGLEIYKKIKDVRKNIK